MHISDNFRQLMTSHEGFTVQKMSESAGKCWRLLQSVANNAEQRLMTGTEPLLGGPETLNLHHTHKQNSWFVARTNPMCSCRVHTKGVMQSYAS